MRGIETMPIQTLLTVIIVFLVASVGFWQLTVWANFKAVKDFKEGTVSVWTTMRSLQSAGDKGSFTTIWLTVPSCCALNISIDDDQLVAILPNETWTVNTTADITTVIQNDTTTPYTSGSVTFGPGSYELRLYYGPLAQNKSWTIAFE
ncbi:MAG: hypothetical protein QW751_01065 [Candidatus Aenigmatarchaeota archaeon]|nr:hypothetical protein [Candidatus Aenigmarchaeota archaeon]